MMTDYRISKRNELIEASYRLSLNEARIILYGLSLINTVSTQFPLEYKIEIKDFAEMFNIDSNNIYKLIKETVMDKFWDREFTYHTENERNIRARWLTSIEYADNEGYIKIYINPKLQPFLHQLHGNFTSYQTKQISSFKSSYSIRFYEIILMNINKSKKEKHTFTLTIEYIKQLLHLTEKYDRFCDFKRYVLDVAKKEINKSSDLKLTYEVMKNGRTPYQIRFTVVKDNQNEKTILPPKLAPYIFEKAKKIILEARASCDLYVVEQEFYDHVRKKGFPDNYEGAFIGFVKKKAIKYGRC